MKFLILLPGLLFFYLANTFAQDTLKKTKPITTNPIIYAETSIGAGLAGVQGFQFGLGLNYQLNKGLFTLRYIRLQDLSITVLPLAPVVFLPGIRNNGSLDEYALMYGLRLINGGHSFSFSAGISTNNRIINYKDDHNQSHSTESRYAGIPFEANFLLFKPTRQRIRIYDIIPVGKPTAFGGSIGLKLAGNVSQRSYLAMGLVFGMGYHKHY
ncbi:hypothetical protein [Mucilaginibacter sp.]|uniref:hypothetical protein n=1 Tax=Mucilaginibacter sp. TaxID=1882438 RepID=UPI003D0D7E1F